MPALVSTSIEAYQQKVADGSLETDRAKILWLINQYGGVTIWEAAKHLGRPDSDISSRFRELEKARIIEKSQTVFKVNPRTKKRAHVWVRQRTIITNGAPSGQTPTLRSLGDSGETLA